MAPSVEISVPSATPPSSSGKSYTLYNITLRLPLRTFTIQKRYSDFVELHSQLSNPPFSLPPKTWRSSSPSLVETRRQGLEAYLQSINSADDSKWRNSPSWRAFLNLPSSTASANASSAHAAIANAASEGPITDPTVWLDAHREAKAQLHDARLHLSRRDGANSAQGQHEAGAAAKRCLVKAGTMIIALEQGLLEMAREGVGKLGDGEMRRRKDLVAAVRREKEGLEAVLNSLATRGAELGRDSGAAAATAKDKEGLFATQNSSQTSLGGGRVGRVLGAPLQETELTRERDNEQVLQLQKQLMVDQDSQVEQLRKIVARQKEIGIDINNELEVQNAMLKLLDEDVDRVDGKVRVAKKRVGKIS